LSLAGNPQRLLRTAIFAATQQKLLRGRRESLAGTSGTAQSTLPAKPGFALWRQKRFADFCAPKVGENIYGSLAVGKRESATALFEMTKPVTHIE
jgi:hypothetical protein